MAGKRSKPKPPPVVLAPEPRPSPVRPLARIAFKAMLAAGVIVLVLVAVVRLGGIAGRQLTGEQRYEVPFTAIQCDAPPGIDRLTFLTEVRFLGQATETISIVDPALPETLAALFAKHPWTQDVTSATVGPDGVVRVNLTFRTAVLAVGVAGESDLRAVDRFGVLLPTTAPTAELTRLLNLRPKPAVSPGKVWPDEQVTRAADLTQTYKPRTIEKTDKGWRLVQADGKPPLIVGW